MRYLLIGILLLVGCVHCPKCPKCPEQVYVFPGQTQEDMRRDMAIEQQVELQREQLNEIRKINEK